MINKRERAPRNRTITLTSTEESLYEKRLLHLSSPARLEDVVMRTINQDTFQVIEYLPAACVDLLVLDPPYNITKTFNGNRFSKRDINEYTDWMAKWLEPMMRLLKNSATVYVCSDWLTSVSVHSVLCQHLIVRNRITWEREKGRGAKTNWKNCSEDIWFATVSDDYVFNVDAVRLKRKVIAPYRVDGKPKDWEEDEKGQFRMTSPSNLWSDITIPFWSMPENTDHPTQKPEKLIAKLLLASSNQGDVVLDPFLGSGTTSVVARKLGRKFIGIECEKGYCCLAEHRLELAESNQSIQGYSDGVFWERNTLQEQKLQPRRSDAKDTLSLFGD